MFNCPESHSIECQGDYNYDDYETRKMGQLAFQNYMWFIWLHSFSDPRKQQCSSTHAHTDTYEENNSKHFQVKYVFVILTFSPSFPGAPGGPCMNDTTQLRGDL